MWPSQMRARLQGERTTLSNASISTPIGAANRPSTADHARAIALRALGFVFGDRAYLDRFLCSVTVSLSELRRQPSSPTHLAAVLDFIIDNELILLRFARTVDLPVDSVYEARRQLGSQAPNRGHRGNWRFAASNHPPRHLAVGSTS